MEGPSDVTTGEAAKFSCEIGAAFPKPQIFWTKIIGDTVSEVAEEETEIEVVQMPYGVSQVSRYTLRVEGDTGGAGGQPGLQSHQSWNWREQDISSPQTGSIM